MADIRVVLDYSPSLFLTGGALEQLPDYCTKELEEKGSTDFTLSIRLQAKKPRKYFRCNAFFTHNRRHVNLILRDIQAQLNPTISDFDFSWIPSLKQNLEKSPPKRLPPLSVPAHLLLPRSNRKFQVEGLHLVFGGTGSGKSTVADKWASFALDEAKDGHIIRFGDPIEGLIRPNLAPSHQDVTDFDKATLESPRNFPRDSRSLDDFSLDVLRQKGRIVTISELRKKEDFAAAIQLAATGHCVFATSHASSIQDAFLKLIQATDSLETTENLIPLLAVLKTVVFAQPGKLTLDKKLDGFDDDSLKVFLHDIWRKARAGIEPADFRNLASMPCRILPKDQETEASLMSTANRPISHVSVLKIFMKHAAIDHVMALYLSQTFFHQWGIYTIGGQEPQLIEARNLKRAALIKEAFGEEAKKIFEEHISAHQHHYSVSRSYKEGVGYFDPRLMDKPAGQTTWDATMTTKLKNFYQELQAYSTSTLNDRLHPKPGVAAK